MSVTWYRSHADGITLTLHVQPGAKRSEIVGLHGDALKLKLAAPPVEGKANEALRRFIAEQFQVGLRDVTLKQGTQSRYKVVLISNSKISPETLLSST
ncbi:MAG: DUF167 domain-containing protein [Sideroxydans sp.]|nr:DUF167 domain-containing protein [Sideroxydans sp.]